MSLVGFQGQNHPQQVDARGARSFVDDRETTDEVFGPLDEEWGFTVDVAASEDNAKLGRFFTIEDDGLAQSWEGERVWCNPPYSDIRPWVEKAWGESAEVVVMILPANRTEQGWWQDLVEPYRDRPGSPLTTEFIRGRVRFIGPDADEVGTNERPPFGSVFLTWDRRRPDLQGIQTRMAV